MEDTPVFHGVRINITKRDNFATNGSVQALFIILRLDLDRDHYLPPFKTTYSDINILMVCKTEITGSKLSIKFLYQYFSLLKQSDRTCYIN